MRSRGEDPEQSPATGPDEWGIDPTVRAMRRVFAAMEKEQKEFINNLGLSPLDPRMRRWRERALAAFDASWARNARTGVQLSETETGALYVHCLGNIMNREGIDVPAEILPRSEKLQKILREVFP
ncbi:MAG: uncharacterized protein H6Q48_1339 [Deltaproteobacteria bacterium]|jgi:hypothetical protein|nr:uncharacterized protein [Deltaproteobacteria bacterium]